MAVEAGKKGDIKGSDLSQQRFQMLADIAKELAGEVVFPTSFDAALHIRELLKDPNLSIDRLAKQISLEPVIAARLLKLANSAAYNPRQQEVRDVKSAISRLGMTMVCNTAQAIALKQLLGAKQVVEFTDITNLIWDHTLYAAGAAYVLARRLTRFSPDEALLCGLVHDLGAFYMLYRATQYPELRQRPDTLRYLIFQWHESIGESLLAALGMPEAIIDAVRDNDIGRPIPATPTTMNDVIYVANQLAGGYFELLLQDKDEELSMHQAMAEHYGAYQEEIQAQVAAMHDAFR